jgi:ABC-type polar amino acid transport system ATPase subunit
MLRVKNLSKKFDHKIILNNVSFSIDYGHIALFLGASGVGKSTLLRIFNNLETPDSGSILLDDKPLDLTNVNQSHITGMVFQQFNLFENLTVAENITFPLEKAAGYSRQKAHEQAMALLEKYHLADKANMRVSQLSGGQKQRLAIARTVALKPRIICMDEPTSALDPMLTSAVAQSIQELSQEKYIVLVASHDIKLLEKLTCTIYLMEHGEIVQTAFSQDFLTDPQKYPKIQQFVRG